MNTDSSGTSSASRKYALSLKGEGMSVERQIDEATALEVLALVMGESARPPRVGEEGETPPMKVPTRRSGNQSLREYLDEANVTRSPDKIVTIAKYISDETGKSFTRKDVKSRYQDAAEPVPGNYGRDFQWTVRNGWIAPVPNTKGEFYVTDAGTKAIEGKFSAEIKKKTGVSRGRRGAKRRTKKSTTSE
jgi:hypothetical protein